ncbi:uncharacterized protein LOC124445155 [Xenia sp. Carnegie-2017]|uniref:uncharacterized protein LOC124445155 n=1 Tax=Xenia sp. Carnegie-2017 TaxID=2897299 RepID=UPI001F03FB28|nr:uncharacterized protein LOC124445155 [Xenia sp. Carnegie-2017]
MRDVVHRSNEHSSSPKILDSSSPSTVHTERGEQIRLKCLYHADTNVKINWMKNGLEVHHNCDTCIFKVETLHESNVSFLQFRPYVKDDFGVYECRVRNTYGTAKYKISVKRIDLSFVAVFVLIQGILVMLLLIDQIVEFYTHRSVNGALRKYFHERFDSFKKEYSRIMKEVEDSKRRTKDLFLLNLQRVT